MPQVEGMSVASWSQKLFDELKRRRVFRVATLYVIAFWPVIQIVDILSPAMDLPTSVMRYLVIAFIAGFPLAVILAWIFDFNKDGITLTTEESDSEAPFVARRSEMVIIGGLLVLVTALFLVQLQLGEPAQEAPTSEATSTSLQYSVAVLPFVSFSDDNVDQQFADGLTEELLNVLSRVKSLRVAARTSAFAYRGVNKNITEIGAELNVGIILEGSVRRNDTTDEVRVTAQLIETKSGSHLWSKTYDREFTDIFKIQDDIASAVVDELQITLLGSERERIKSRSSATPEALVAYGLGQSDLGKRTEQSFVDAIRFFKKAIELDPNYVDAQVGLATAHALNASYEHQDAATALPLAQAAIDQAFSLDAESGIAWATQGLIYMEEMRRNDALAALEKAMEYNPSHAEAYMWYASLQEDKEDQLNLYQKAYKLDPKSAVIGYNVASILIEQGREAEAMQLFDQIIESNPHYHGAYHLAARINETRGRLDEAINQYERAFELSGNERYGASIAALYIDLGDFDTTQFWLNRISDNLNENEQTLFDWLQVSSYASAGRLDEVGHYLVAKINAADTFKDNRHYEDATIAAYYLRDYDKVISNFEKIDDAALMFFEKVSRIDAMLAAGFAYKQLGDIEDMQSVLLEVETIIDEYIEARMIDNNIWYAKAQMAALRDEPQMAMFHLQRAIDEGWRSHWLTMITPILGDIEQEPAFQSMMAGLETRMDIMREQLILASTFNASWSS